LTVTDTGTLSAVATRVLTVESQVATNQAPTAKLTKTSQTFGALVVSTVGSFDPENVLASGTITWGDGQTTSWTGAPAASYSHTYTSTASLRRHVDRD
jgi:hypothetical protein